MKPVDVKSSTYIDFNVRNHDKDLKLEDNDYVKIANMETFFQKSTLQINLKNCLWLKKVKNTAPPTHVIEELDGEKLLGILWKKTKSYTFRIEKLIKKVINYTLSGRVIIISLNSWIDKKDIV